MLAASSRPAFAPITADDHAGYLWIITILGAIYTIIVALVRVYVKYRVVGIDDYLLGIATVSIWSTFTLDLINWSYRLLTLTDPMY